MKKIFSLMLCLCMSLGVLSNISLVAFAAENETSLPYNHCVVDIEYVPYEHFIEQSNSINNEITPRSRVKYIVKNVKNTGETLGDVKYTSDEGTPGVSVGMNRSKSISASCSVSGIPILKAVSAKLGFNVTGSYSVGVSSSWVVPERWNGKKVKYGYIVAKPVYDNWKYSVYIDSNRIDETFLMNGTAQKPKNRMRIEKVIVYQ